MTTATPDVVVSGSGTVYLFALQSAEARAWVAAHVEAEDYMFFGRETLAVEHRCVEQVVEGMMLDGLTVANGD